MGFGALIAVGDRNRLLADELMNCVTEVRVEQSLDENTYFAIRFQDDITDGDLAILQEPDLQSEHLITIAVEAPDGVHCLVRGPITEVKYSARMGGTGSWYEIRGEDRRVEMDRECTPRTWSGRASEAARALLRARGFVPCVDQTPIVYGAPQSNDRPTSGTLNQQWTDADFIRRIAARHNLHFWLEYRCRVDGGPAGPTLSVVETANLKASPPRPSAGAAPGALSLVPTSDIRLRINVDQGRCATVTAFELTENPERPNRFGRIALNEHDLAKPRMAPVDPQPPIRPGGLRFGGATQPRDVCLTIAGNEDELQARAESVLTDAGWFLHATASTTVHMLGGALVPHQIVEVEGLGSRHSGAYQVKSVTHVINAADHFMDLELRRNAVGHR